MDLVGHHDEGPRPAVVVVVDVASAVGAVVVEDPKR